MVSTKRSSLKQLVRENDYDRYLASLFVVGSARTDIWALIAFNFEIAKTAEVVSEPLLGEIRLQWWREAIEEIYDGKPVREHEVVKALADVIHKHQLPKPLFEAMIAARLSDLEEKPFSRVEELVDYAGKTAGSLLLLCRKILKDTTDEAAILALGQAYALAGLLRALGHLSLRNRQILPEDLLARHELKSQHFLEKAPAAHVQSLVAEIALIALKKLEVFEGKPAAKFFRVTALQARYYLSRAQKTDSLPKLATLRRPSLFKLVVA